MNDIILFFFQISVFLAYMVGLWVAARFLAAFTESFVTIVVNSTIFLNFPTSTVRGPLGFVAGWILGAVIFLAIFRFLDYRLSIMEGNEAVEV